MHFVAATDVDARFISHGEEREDAHDCKRSWECQIMRYTDA